MGMEGLKGPESNAEKPLESLNSQEIIDRYSSKVTDKAKAEKYLRGLDQEMVYGKNGPDYKKHNGVAVSFLSKELLRYISDRNDNLNFGPNIALADLPKEDAYAYIAYAQDMLGLGVDGLIGDKTKDKLASINKERVALTIQKAKDRRWLMAEIDKALEREKALEAKKNGVKSGVEVASSDDPIEGETMQAEREDDIGQTVGIPEIKKGKSTVVAENYRPETPEIKGVSKEDLAKEVKKIENVASFRKVKAKIPKLMAKYNTQIEGGTPDLVKRAKENKAKLERVVAILESDDYKDAAKNGFVSFQELMVTLGEDAPEDLN